MDEWEHYFAEGSKHRGQNARRRSLGLAIENSALVTLTLILWFLKAEVRRLPLNQVSKSHSGLRTSTQSAARHNG